MTEAERMVERLNALAEEWWECCGDIHEPILEAAALIQQQAERIRELEGALHRLRVAATLLLENAKGCAVNHYGDDFSEKGIPGWLADCARDIETARAALAKSGQSNGEGVG